MQSQTFYNSLIMVRLLLPLLLLTSCMKTEVLNAPIEQTDTVLMHKPHRPPHPPLPPRDTTSVDDTSRVGIGFNPTVEDWDGTDVDM